MRISQSLFPGLRASAREQVQRSLREVLCVVVAASLGAACSSDGEAGAPGGGQPEGGAAVGPTAGGSTSGATGVSGGGSPGGQTSSATAGGPGGPGDSMAAPNFDAECGAVSQTAENVLQPVDIIFGIDTSGSMAEEVAEVRENLNAFSQQIIDAGIDVHVIMVAALQGAGATSGGYAVDGPCIAPPLGSGQCPDDSNPPGYAHVDEKVTSWDVLDVFIRAYPSYKPYLRENSLKQFVAISDDDATAQTNPAGVLVGMLGGLGDAIAPVPEIDTPEKFQDAVDGLEPGSLMWASWRYNAIFSFTGTCASSATGGAEGVVHRQLVEQTGGVAGDLCLQDFAPVFDQVAKQVTETVSLACDWTIPPPPDGEKFDPTQTNVQVVLDGVTEGLPKVPAGQVCDDRGGWHYDDEANPKKVVACPASCQRLQSVGSTAQVDLLFGCATVVLL